MQGFGDHHDDNGVRADDDDNGVRADDDDNGVRADNDDNGVRADDDDDGVRANDDQPDEPHGGVRTAEGLGKRATDQDTQDTDVLEDYYARNRRPRPPSPSRLLGLRPQVNRPRRNTNPDAADESDNDSTRPSRQKRNSKTPKQARCADPTQLAFYPPKWRDLLEECKIETRTYAAIHEPWPHGKAAMTGFISDAIAMMMQKWRRKGRTIEKHHYPEHRGSMCKLVRISMPSRACFDAVSPALRGSRFVAWRAQEGGR